MRWQKQTKREWDVGEQRVKIKFLIRPRCLPVGGYGGAEMEWRWLEKARIVQELTSKYHLPVFGSRDTWKNLSWGG